MKVVYTYLETSMSFLV